MWGKRSGQSDLQDSTDDHDFEHINCISFSKAAPTLKKKKKGTKTKSAFHDSWILEKIKISYFFLLMLRLHELIWQQKGLFLPSPQVKSLRSKFSVSHKTDVSVCTLVQWR